MILFSFSLVGCNTKGNDESNAQKLVNDWVNMYYTIDETDFEFYEKMTTGFKDVKREDAQIIIDYYNEYTEKFKPFLTDTVYESLNANRAFFLRTKEAYEEKYYVTVKNIKLEKYLEKNTENHKQEEDELMLVYYFDVELIQTSLSDNETKNVKVRRQISVSKIEDSWKVRHFRTIY